MLNAYQEQLVSALRSVPISGPPTPWNHISSPLVGGVQALGFSESEEYLLLISSSGRGVIDLPSGARAGRDHDSSYAWYDIPALTADGIGPIGGERVRVAGIHGGGFPTVTHDGWSLARVAPDWPNQYIFLSPPQSSVFDQREGRRTYNLGPGPAGDTIIAFGFSKSGAYFFFATSSELELFGRGS